MGDDGPRSSLYQKLFRRAMTLPLLSEWLAAMTPTEATIFMAHRFSVPALGVSGYDPQNLRQILAQLRRGRYTLLSIEEIFRRLSEHRPPNRGVAFTIDDGYFDDGQ